MLDLKIINGRIVVQAGAFTGVAPSTVLRSGRDTYTVGLRANAMPA